ncbi:hypothetical protein VE01_09002 [Pseudogymnoascus verrucosus]|uniref:Uncharacterized protein n=1 Tax=Pseudogymnoascus verrucosus TaxID=342668 RepID=A0A1B8GB30_9PEZI|nr:uncharacterized protein VE01_09002 [Pseudogymnoascus verrucosus]OBT93043.1 hypothetical protein VE01_09002 [Pseudogymnoascus verrucosus]
MRKDEGLLQTAITTIGLAVPEQIARDSATSYVTDVNDDLDTVAYLDSLKMLGNLCSDQGKLAEAEEMYQRALKGKEKALGAEHTSTLRTVNNLGNLYADQGKLAEAEEMYQRALKGNEKARGPAIHLLTAGDGDRWERDFSARQ